MDCQTGKGPTPCIWTFLPVWCVCALTLSLMTPCTITTFVNVFAGNLSSLVSEVFVEYKLYMGMLNDYGSSCRRTGT